MKRRSSRARPAVKTGRRKKALKRQNGPKVVRRRTATATSEREVERLRRELSETLRQQTASSDVLRLISSSHTELTRIFETILANATKLCDANFGVLTLYEGDAFRVVALHNAPPAFVELRRREPVMRAGPLMRIAVTKQPIHISDLGTQHPAFKQDDADSAAFSALAGVRTVVVVPMLKEQELVGTIGIYRREVLPFTEKQIELLRNFASQAVIAIENARLLNELRQSLEQQTATSEVLKVISSSPGQLEPVFEAMLENATRICEAKFGALYRYDGNEFHLGALLGAPPAFTEFQQQRGAFKPPPGTPLDRLLRTKEVIRTADDSASKIPSPSAQLAGAKSHIAVPMFKDNELVGAIVIYRQEVRPFTDKQVELVQNFAAQAVIAIENARLLNELRQRTDDLTESLEQQTATSEVLKIISSSPGDLQPVFNAMLANATRICEAEYGFINEYKDGLFQNMAQLGGVPAYLEKIPRGPARRGPETVLGRIERTKQLVQIDNLSKTRGYAERDPIVVAAVEIGGVRTILGVPMFKDDELAGAVLLYRKEVRPFTEKQIDLIKNFAAQAVIAIENTRLLNDLNKLNQQLEQRVADQVNEIERMGRLRRFLPPQVADLIVASGTEKQLESHRREITALFCDLRGFTGFSESSDPEDVMDLLREYHAAIGGIINKYGGTLERYAGDGVMVIFNDPIPVDNPALQAVLMAIDMRAAIGGLMEKWRKLGHDIGFGIGIAHGFATLGTIGFEGRFDYAAIGTVSNVASRLCDEAKPGQILISPRVLMAVEKDIAVEPVGDFALKGIRRPLTAYNVLAAKTAN